MRGFYGYRRYIPRGTLIKLLAAVVFTALAILIVVGTGQMRTILTRLATTRVNSTVT